MAEKEKMQARPAHNIIMENRKLLNLSGVKDVDSFDEQTVCVQTQLGNLTVKGDGLHISRLDQETGEMSIDGEISELVYSEIKDESQGFFARLFR
ncbi:MAG: sporulation protein YabP [Ruminococcaceae bacterium]|nr:sporulation protein YabP [Oscillospiraceae bacterium]